MAEQWRPADGFELYEVSDLGRVRNVKSGRLLAGATNGGGYLQVQFRAPNGKKKTLSVHRLVAIAFHGFPAPGQVCNHLSGVKADNRAQNLEWCSRAENSAHAVSIGLWRGLPGERNPRAKLREDDVVEMRRLSREGLSYTELADRFVVTPQTAYRAVVGQTWNHIPLAA
jgi:hypothetical protein